MAIAVSAYRFGAEDGTEATHTFLANLNTALSRDKNSAATFFVRFLIQATGAGQNNIDFRLQRSLDGGAFADVTTSSTGVKAVATAIFVDQANTTSRLGGTGTFESSSAGCSETGLCGGTAFDIVTSGCGETLYSVQLVPADLTNITTVTFQLLADGVGFTQSVTPTINLTDPNVTATPLAGSLAVSGVVPTIAAGSAVTTILSALSIRGIAPSFEAGSDFAGSTLRGSLALTGVAPDVPQGLIERLTANTILASSNLQDTLSNIPPQRLLDIDDDVDGSPGPDEEWWTAVDPEANISVRLGFPTSSGNLVGTQQFRVYIRGTSLPSTDVTLELWENGSKLTSENTDAVSSITGQIVTVSFDASELSDITGAGVELRIHATAA